MCFIPRAVVDSVFSPLPPRHLHLVACRSSDRRFPDDRTGCRRYRGQTIVSASDPFRVCDQHARPFDDHNRRPVFLLALAAIALMPDFQRQRASAVHAVVISILALSVLIKSSFFVVSGVVILTALHETVYARKFPVHAIGCAILIVGLHLMSGQELSGLYAYTASIIEVGLAYPEFLSEQGSYRNSSHFGSSHSSSPQSSYILKFAGRVLGAGSPQAHMRRSYSSLTNKVLCAKTVST